MAGSYRVRLVASYEIEAEDLEDAEAEAERLVDCAEVPHEMYVGDVDEIRPSHNGASTALQEDD